MTEKGPAIDVALCQYELCGAASIDTLTRRAAALFERAGPADLYVLPELVAVDLVESSDASVETAALDTAREDRLHAFLQRAADDRDAVVVGGSYDVVDGGTRYNRCPIAHPDGELTTYDKHHPTPEERDGGKARGTADPPVIDRHGVGIGVVICYDVEFPETVRRIVDAGAEVLAVPSWTATEAGHQRVRRCAAARAIENQVYVVYVPLVGQHRHEPWTATGRAAVFAPADDVVGPYATRLSLPRDTHTAARCQLDIGALRESRHRAGVRPYADYRARHRQATE